MFESQIVRIQLFPYIGLNTLFRIFVTYVTDNSQGVVNKVFVLENEPYELRHEKPCETKDADQLRGNREADQRLCFRYIDSTIPLLSKSEISSL